MSGGAPVDGGPPVAAHVLGDVRGEPEATDVSDETFGVVVLVTRYGVAPLGLGETVEHLERCGLLGVAVGGGEFGIDDQSGAVLDQQVPGVAQRRRGVVRLAIQACLRVRR